MMPICKRSLGSKHFCRLCPEVLAESCVVDISTLSRRLWKRPAFSSLLRKKKIVTVEKSARLRPKLFPPVEEPKVNIQQIVEACVKQLQAQQPKKEQSERSRGSRKKYRCWCCGEDGHTLRDCPTILQNRAAYFKQPTSEQAEN